ncbi:MAG: hypothetical protein IT343_09440, partial [Candidatus Melainabacteria bacterium]|nr:hypothetical protein [Candidatus Melainabacteria bacterium]
MQKLSAIAILSFCLLTAMSLICELPANGQVNEQALRSANAGVVATSEANNGIAVQREYRLTVNDLQRLYRQSTDGMAPSSAVTQDPATIMYSRGPVVPLSSIQLPDNMRNMLSTGVPTQGLPLTDTAFKAQLLQTQQQLLSQISDPIRNIPRELAQTLATQTMLGNSAAQVATEQANNAINYAAKYLINFTVNESNVWNRLRNNIFVPIALLLLVPGTVLTQAKAIMAAGNPVIEYTNPFEGILRAIIAMCFIPGSYLVVNYGIDFSNSISHTIQDAYRSQFGGDMYADAFRAEQRAFPSRQAAENQNGLSGLGNGATATGGNNVTGFAQLENNLIKNKTFAGNGTQVATNGLVDEVLPANAVAARMAIFGTNMVVTSVWDLLCAFQLVYLHYLFLVGPIMAAIWVYPIKQLREAWPNWVAGTITLCFWSLFWNTAILLMALFKDADSTGTFIMTALNLLATGSVKYAFDFVGLITEAGQEAAKIARTGKNEQGGNITPVPGTNTEKTRTFSENTKETGNGGMLGGITKVATAAALGAAMPGAAPAVSLGSQLLGAFGGGKDGGASNGISDFAKSLSLPPLVSSVSENAFPASAAAFGIVGAAGLLGKEEISLPPLSGDTQAGGALGALANAAQSEQAASSIKISTDANIVAGTVGDIAEAASSNVGKSGSDSFTAINGLAGLANSGSAATAPLSQNNDSPAAESEKTKAAEVAAKQHDAQASTKTAMRALIAGSAAAAANRSSSFEVQNFMTNLAQAAGAEHAASVAGLPPSARTAQSKGSSAGTISNSSNNTNNLFKESARSLQTESARELSYEVANLNFSAAPPLAFASTTTQFAPPPMASTLHRMAAGDIEYIAGGMSGLVGFAEAVAPQISAPEMSITEAGSGNFYRTVAESGAPANTTVYVAAETQTRMSALPPANELVNQSKDASGAVPVVRERERLFRLAIEAKVEADAPTSGVLLSLTEVQAVSGYRKPKGLQELMKKTAFERPCDNCKHTGCQCAINAPVAVGMWS